MDKRRKSENGVVLVEILLYTFIFMMVVLFMLFFSANQNNIALESYLEDLCDVVSKKSSLITASDDKVKEIFETQKIITYNNYKKQMAKFISPQIEQKLLMSISVERINLTDSGEFYSEKENIGSKVIVANTINKYALYYVYFNPQVFGDGGTDYIDLCLLKYRPHARNFFFVKQEND